MAFYIPILPISDDTKSNKIHLILTEYVQVDVQHTGRTRKVHIKPSLKTLISCQIKINCYMLLNSIYVQNKAPKHKQIIQNVLTVT